MIELMPEIDKALLRRLVDIVWQEATESTEVPSTRLADTLIDQALAVTGTALRLEKPVKEAIQHLLRREWARCMNEGRTLHAELTEGHLKSCGIPLFQDETAPPVGCSQMEAPPGTAPAGDSSWWCGTCEGIVAGKFAPCPRCGPAPRPLGNAPF